MYLLLLLAPFLVFAFYFFVLRPKKGKNHSDYFTFLQQGLKNHKRAIPSLVLDLDRLDKNIVQLKSQLIEGAKYRIVVKSLPSLGFIKYLFEKTNSQELMVFHQPFLNIVSKEFGSEVNVLIGKPFPIKTCEYYYSTLDNTNGFNPDKQVQWLVDSLETTKKYIALAEKLNRPMLLNVELDIGLHRGGINSHEALKEILMLINNYKDTVTFSGFMGYDAHVTKIPPFIMSQKEAFKKANDFYGSCIYLIKETFPQLWRENLTFNGAGSPSISLHKNGKSVINDISVGSALVKPTSFDIASLNGYVPSVFIAVPVLKKLAHTQLPSIEKLKKLITFLNPNFAISYYLYGGSWKGTYVSPRGVKENSLFGISTNQVMVTSSKNVDLAVDDFVFIRPYQSEFIFLQFPEILTFRKGEIIGSWDIFNQQI